MIKIDIVNDFKILQNFNDLRSKMLKIWNKSISVGLASIISTR